MSETIQSSYLKAVYGRHCSSCKVTRFFKVDSAGKISYVEKRDHAIIGTTDVKTNWRIGNISFMNVNNSALSASSREEYEANLDTAIKSII